MNQQALSTFIWSVADLLRGDYKQSDYGKVILPFTVLRRLDCVLEPTKDAVLAEMTEKIKLGINPEPFLRRKADRWGPWAISQIELHDWRMVLEAGHAIGSFSATEWLPEIDVPTSHVVTLRDPVIPAYRQLDLVSRIPTAEAVRIDAEHDAIVAHSDRMAVHIVEGAHSVLRRSAPSATRAS